MVLWTGLMLTVYFLLTGLPKGEAAAGYNGISEFKTILYYCLMGLLLLLGLWRLWGEIRSARRKKTRLAPLTAAQWAALTFLAFTLISAACSHYGAKAWYNAKAHEGALTISLYVLSFLILSRWGRLTPGLGKAALLSLGAFCLLCLLQMAGANPLGLYPPGMNYYDGFVKYAGSFAGTLGNVDLVSAFLALAIPMLAVWALREKKQALPQWVLAALCLAILIWVKVLCGLVGLAAGGVLCLLVLCPDEKRKPLLLLFGGLALGGLVLLWAVDLPVKFLHELHELLHGRAEDSFGTGRFYIWRQMLARIPDRLLVGTGPDTARFTDLAPFVRRDELGNVVYDAAGRAITATITDAHCYPLHILYCQGLPALLSWLSLVGVALVHWYQGRRELHTALLGAGLVCFLCAMLFCFSSVIIMPYLWLTLGLLEASRKN